MFNQNQSLSMESWLGPNAKKQKPSVDSGSKPGMILNELNIDCLEEILSFLDLEDLLNVADTNRRLHRAAGFVFDQKYRKKQLYLSPFSLTTVENLTFDEEFICIVDIQYCLRFIRCFGPSISQVAIECTDDDEGCCTELFRYVNKYCANSLIELNVEGCDKSIFDRMHQPFEKIEEISFQNCALNQLKLNEYFPQVKRLSLNRSRINSQYIAVNLPHLEYFQYAGNIDNELPEHVTMENFEQFIRLNPQLESITIDGFWYVERLRYMSEHLHRLEELRVTMFNRSTDVSDTKEIRFKSVKKFELLWCSFDLFPGIALSFDQLEVFRTVGIPYNYLLDFVQKNQTISTLKILSGRHNGSLNIENIIEIAKALPSLTNLDVSSANENGISIDKAYRLTIELKQLQKLSFLARNEPDAVNSHTKLGSEWHFEYMNDGFIIVNFKRSTTQL